VAREPGPATSYIIDVSFVPIQNEIVNTEATITFDSGETSQIVLSLTYRPESK
jgi:hypothetical protein